MIHELDLLDKLTTLPSLEFQGEVYRATRKNLDPLAPSNLGGRWMPRAASPVLYTSTERDGALAELAYHWGMLEPLPTSPAIINRLKVGLPTTLRIVRANLNELGIEEFSFEHAGYEKMQKVGAAVAFLEYDGLLIPSARWPCENLIVFTDNLSDLDSVEWLGNEEVDWLEWKRNNEYS